MYTHQTIAEFSYRYGEVFPPSLLASKWEDLTLADYVVFGTVMLRPDLCKRLIELALQIPIDRIEYVEREKDLRAMPGTPGVRLDVYVGDGTGRMFNVELQRRDEKYLPQRARYYQASICHEMAEAARRKAADEGRGLTWGERYGSIKESYVIFVCLHDPFGRGWKRYVFKNLCVGDPSLSMGDGTCEVFLNADWNTQGADDGEGDLSTELDDFLAYLKGGYDGDDVYVRELDAEVKSVITQPEWRKRVMFEYEVWEDIAGRIALDSIKEGREKGIEEGREKGIEEGREEQVKLFAKLAAALETQGRGDELLPALQDEEKLKGLLEEFGLHG